MLNKAKPRVVLDSVVLVSAFITESGLSSELLDKSAETAELYITEEILQETRRVLLERDHLRRRFLYNNTNVEDFIEALRAKCLVITSLPDIQIIERDPKDDKIIACAVAAHADYIISRDLHLLDLKEYEGIKIISPESFIHYLRSIH